MREEFNVNHQAKRDVDMLARFLGGTSGRAALSVARKTADRLTGFFEGQLVWNFIADAVECRSRSNVELVSVMPVS